MTEARNYEEYRRQVLDELGIEYVTEDITDFRRWRKKLLNGLADIITKGDMTVPVAKWLDAHPEATTSVEDGSLTEAKFDDELKLKAIKDYVTPEMFGAKGDGVTDDTNAIQSAINTEKPVVALGTYFISNTILLNGNKTFACDGVIIYGGEKNKSAIKVSGEYNKLSIGIVIDTLSFSINKYDGGWHGWENNNYSGIELSDASFCKIHFDKIVNFTCGLKVISSTATGSTYNEIDGNYIFNCKYSIYINTSNSGWINYVTFSNIMMACGARTTDIATNSANITTYGVYQTKGAGNTYGARYLKFIKCFSEYSYKDTYTAFYFNLASECIFNECDVEITNNATFALFDMQYTQENVNTILSYSSNNVFYSCRAMGNNGNNIIKYLNTDKAISSLIDIAKHSDVTENIIYSDNSLCMKALNIDNNNHSSLKGYGFVKMNYVGNMNEGEEPRTVYSKISNTNTGVRVSSGYPIAILLSVSVNETYRVCHGNPNGAIALKTFDVDGNLIEPSPTYSGKKIIGTNLVGEPNNDHIYKGITTLTDIKFSIIDANIKYVMILLYNFLDRISVYKYDNSSAIVQKFWGNLSFARNLGDVFMSKTEPTSARNTETCYDGQRVYDVSDQANMGKYWELQNGTWTYV